MCLHKFPIYGKEAIMSIAAKSLARSLPEPARAQRRFAADGDAVGSVTFANLTSPPGRAGSRTGLVPLRDAGATKPPAGLHAPSIPGKLSGKLQRPAPKDIAWSN
jgi:hypothetical protein